MSRPSYRCHKGSGAAGEEEEAPAVVFDKLNRRCLANAEARNAAESIRGKCAESLKTIREHDKRHWLETITEGFGAVARCRTTISYGYVRLHGLRKFQTAKELFRFALSDLELRTDDLQEALENLASEQVRSADKLERIRVDVQALVRLLDTFLLSFSASTQAKETTEGTTASTAAADEHDEADEEEKLKPYRIPFPSTLLPDDVVTMNRANLFSISFSLT